MKLNLIFNKDFKTVLFFCNNALIILNHQCLTRDFIK